SMAIDTSQRPQLFFGGDSARLALCRQFIKWSAILSADECRTLHGFEQLVTSLFLENLRDRFELGSPLGPRPLGPPEAFLEFTFETLKVQVIVGEVVHGFVARSADLRIIEIGIDGAGHVARQRPWSCRPDEKVFVLGISQRKSH